METRNNMLENLLILLNSAASLGFGPNPEVFSSNYEPPRTSSDYPGSGKGIRKKLAIVSFLLCVHKASFNKFWISFKKVKECWIDLRFMNKFS